MCNAGMILEGLFLFCSILLSSSDITDPPNLDRKTQTELQQTVEFFCQLQDLKMIKVIEVKWKPITDRALMGFVIMK